MHHGGNLHDAKTLFPEAPEPWLDLSTGINPNAYPFTPPDPRAYTRLPAPQELRRVEEAAARAYGVGDATRIVAGAGSQALIQTLPRLRSPSRVAILGPTYNEHGICWIREGHHVTTVSDLAEAFAQNAEVVIVVNPNNPDGRVIGQERLAKAAARLAKNDGWLVIDEAFADLEDGISVASLDLPATIVLRSFGKAYGLAGVRLGFSIAQHELSERIRSALGSWPVAGPALSIGFDTLTDGIWLEQQKLIAQKAATDLDNLLMKAGFAIVGGTKLFRLAHHEEAWARFESLARAGIWVRKFHHDHAVLRFGLPHEDDAARLESALRAL
ncbi:threonine-phosphate decarboxylase CobD [Microvirga sp. 2MCAF38]|uniref:threonine-phosphate decarboxylase CobD n=1 Tax=Microvirga sp. 2MCAF38 TaxID=3232989 RepID=UPI003F9B036A